MNPTQVPAEAFTTRPDLRVMDIGPPPGVSDDDCGTVQALVGFIDTMPVYCDYWRPNPVELEQLRNGGFIELIQYTPQMVMHSMTVWPAGAEPKDD